MCTYQTEQIKVTGSGKGATGWFGVTDASVYYDHPVHASAEHSLNIDFLNPGQGPAAPGRAPANRARPRLGPRRTADLPPAGRTWPPGAGLRLRLPAARPPSRAPAGRSTAPRPRPRTRSRSVNVFVPVKP